MKNTLALLVVLSMSGSLMAQAEAGDKQDGQAQPIDEILVQASRTNATVASMPNQVTIVSEEEIKRAITLSDSMSGVLELTVPGFSGSSNSQTMRGISLRSADTDRWHPTIRQHVRQQQGGKSHRYGLCLKS